MAAQLPAGQHRLNRRCSPSVDFSFCALFEKAEGQQNTQSCLRRRMRRSIKYTGECQIAEALGQLEAARPCQLKLLAVTRRRKTKAGRVVPQNSEVAPGPQSWQLLLGDFYRGAHAAGAEPPPDGTRHVVIVNTTGPPGEHWMCLYRDPTSEFRLMDLGTQPSRTPGEKTRSGRLKIRFVRIDHARADGDDRQTRKASKRRS